MPHLSPLEGFHRLTQEQRRQLLGRFRGMDPEEFSVFLTPSEGSAFDPAGFALGYFPMPLGVASHFRIDGVDRAIPMAVEETSIIAACSATAKWIRRAGRLETLFVGQTGYVDLCLGRANGELTTLDWRRLTEAPPSAQLRSSLREAGLGDLRIQMRSLRLMWEGGNSAGSSIITEALLDLLADWASGILGFRVQSGLVTLPRVAWWVEARIELDEPDAVLGHGIEEAAIFAQADPYRAATHNKGVMNGIDPILIACGMDWRGVEAGLHESVSRGPRYQPLTQWTYAEHRLIGVCRLPFYFAEFSGGLFDGFPSHPAAACARKVLDVTQPSELARICAAVGLTQNLGALKALASEGIVRGHMQLHAANLALAAGAQAHEVSEVQDRLMGILRIERKISLAHAQTALAECRRTREASVV